MEYKKLLMQGTAVASVLAGFAGAAQAAGSLPTETFVFGYATGVVTATTAQTPASGSTVTALSSQVNNNLGLTSSIDSNAVTSATGATITGGPTTILQNVMSAAAT